MGADSRQSAWACGAADAACTTTIGAVMALTGSLGVLGQQISKGAELGIADVDAAGGANGCQLKLSLLAVDTHGYTKCAMAVAKLLQFDLCVRLRNLSERMLYLPPLMEELPQALDRLRTEKVSLKRSSKDGTNCCRSWPRSAMADSRQGKPWNAWGVPPKEKGSSRLQMCAALPLGPAYPALTEHLLQQAPKLPQCPLRFQPPTSSGLDSIQ